MAMVNTTVHMETSCAMDLSSSVIHPGLNTTLNSDRRNKSNDPNNHQMLNYSINSQDKPERMVYEPRDSRAVSDSIQENRAVCLMNSANLDTVDGDSDDEDARFMVGGRRLVRPNRINDDNESV